MKLAIEVDVPVATCIGCGLEADMTVNAVVRDRTAGDSVWKVSIASKPAGWKATTHDPNPNHGLCPACAEDWVPMATPTQMPARTGAPAPAAQASTVTELPRGVVPPTPLPPIGAPPPILIDSRPKTTSIPSPGQSAVAKSVVPNLAPPMSARPTFVGSVQLAQAPVHVSSQKVEHVKQLATVSPIPQLVPQARPEPPLPAIMSKATVIPAATPAAPVDPTKTGEWVRPDGQGR